MGTIIKELSVNELVYITARSGDIDNSFGRNANINEDTIRLKLISSYNDKYESNVPVSLDITYFNYYIKLKGEIEGLIYEKEGLVVDGLIMTNKPLKDIENSFDRMSFAKLLCYAFILVYKNKLEKITIQQNYCNKATKNIRHIRTEHTKDELEQFVTNLIKKYCEYNDMIMTWENIRDNSIKELQFPFATYRRGQRELAEEVYKSIRDSKNLFVQAPTGVGKTISTLFPAIKAMGEEHISKIFYATAKTITRQVAEESIDIMRSKGLKLKSLVLTAKEKVCFKDDMICTPEYCEFAKGYYDRVTDAIIALYK